jgi:hypothetical protein
VVSINNGMTLSQKTDSTTQREAIHMALSRYKSIERNIKKLDLSCPHALEICCED